MQSFRLSGLSAAAKLTLTAFVLLIGAGYLVASMKIYLWHNAADGVPGMTPDDLKAVYHGLEKVVPADVTVVSPMLREVSPGGGMRKHLMKGGEPAERALLHWLKQGARQDTFDKAGLVQAGDPSPKAVIAAQCIKCHNSQGGEEEDIPYAANDKAEPQYEFVAKMAVPAVKVSSPTTKTIRLEPISIRELVHVTHAHVLAIPLFTLAIAGLFLMTGFGAGFKLAVAPLPMIATCVDIGCWWLARPFEPAIYGILAAGAVFGAGLALQILCILGSMWFGRKPAAE